MSGRPLGSSQPGDEDCSSRVLAVVTQQECPIHCERPNHSDEQNETTEQNEMGQTKDKRHSKPTHLLPRRGAIELKMSSNERGINPGLFNGPIIVEVLPEPVIP